MKKLFFLLALVFTTSMFAQNIVHIQYRYVASENEAEFESLETEHWSKVKKNAIDNGNMLAYHKYLLQQLDLVLEYMIVYLYC